MKVARSLSGGQHDKTRIQAHEGSRQDTAGLAAARSCQDAENHGTDETTQVIKRSERLRSCLDQLQHRVRASSDWHLR
jgi:hypothetical protein